MPACSHCACREWRYGVIVGDGGQRVVQKQCAKCGALWPLQHEAEENEFFVPDPVLVLDYTRGRLFL